MVAVPVSRPVTTPVGDTVAIVAALLLHVPDAVVSASIAEAPLQIEDEPVMAPTTGKVVTVTDWLTLLLQPAVLVTV